MKFNEFSVSFKSFAERDENHQTMINYLKGPCKKVTFNTLKNHGNYLTAKTILEEHKRTIQN